MKRFVTVPGMGRVSASPNVASVRLGVNILRDSAVAARDDAAQTLEAILNAMLEAGVARRDLQTALVSLNAVFDHDAEGGPRVTGYQVTNTLSVTVRELDTTSKLIDAAIWAGASTLDSLEFHLEDGGEAEQQAREAAMEDARERAETLAAAARARLGQVISITEVPPGGRTPYAPRTVELRADAAPTPIESGAQEISVALTVTFELTGGK